MQPLDAMLSWEFPPRKPFTPEHLLTDGSFCGSAPPLPAEFVKWAEYIGFPVEELLAKWYLVRPDCLLYRCTFMFDFRVVHVVCPTYFSVISPCTS